MNITVQNHGGGTATCVKKAKCNNCGNDYGGFGEHAPVYAADPADSSKLIETCSNGCNHSKTATLQLKSDANLTYTGNAIEPLEMIYQEGWLGDTTRQPASTEYTNNVNAGIDTAFCSFAYVDNATVSKPFSITAAAMTAEASGYSGTYDGQSHGITVNAPEGATVKYGTEEGDCTLDESPALTNVGSTAVYYEVTKANYKTVTGSETITVTPAAITVTPDSGKSMAYGSVPELTYTYSGNVNGETPAFSGTLGLSDSNVGSRTITIGSLKLADNGNFKAGNYTMALNETPVGFTVNVADGSASVSVEEWTYGDTANAPVPVSTTNGTNNVTYLYKAKGADDSTYDINVPTNAGFYTVKATFAATNNYKEVTATADFEIKKADPGIGAVTAGVLCDTRETSSIVLTRENTNIDGTLTVDAGQTLAWGDNEIAYTFAPKDATNYSTVTGKVTVTVEDTIAPTGTVTIAAKSWTEFLNTITFGLLFKETQTVSVEAADNLSGVAKIEYVETKAVLDLEGVAALAADQWTQMNNGSVSVTAEDAKQFIYYIRITDKSGNVAYLATNGAEFDTTAPAVSGVSSGVTYYTTQIVNVTDKNLDTVTLNGEAVTGAITLEGNKEVTYTIVATDKAGNTTTVTVKMAAIADIMDSMEGKDSANVASNDKAGLQAIVDIVTELLKDKGITAEEKIELEKAKADAETLLAAIDAAEAANLNKTQTPATGDSFNIWLWTSVMIVSAVAVLLIGLKKRETVK